MRPGGTSGVFGVFGLLGLAVAASVGCTIQELGPQPIAVGPPAQAGYPPPQSTSTMAGGPIQAGCSFNATELQGDPGALFQVACPPGCVSGGLWGTDVYTADSGICHAAIHAGAIPPDGGVVVVRVELGQPAYRGSMRNGTASGDYGNYGRSFTVGPASGQWTAAPQPAPAVSGVTPAAMQVIEAGCSFNSTQIRDQVGTAHVVSCPAGCAATGGLWGTDVYTGDSAICKAAIHAGLISDAGGSVVVVLEPGRPAYRGSVRNRITSGDYGNYGSSYHLQRP